jgi:TonB family protein
MPDSLPQMPSKGPLTTERRQNPRHPVRPTEYIEIGDSNGGIILDISEGGMAVASAQALVGNQTLNFRFQLPRSNETIETSGEINWIGETKKRAGVRFVDLPLAARKQIQKWIDSEISGHTIGAQKTNGSAVLSPSPKIPQEFPRREFVHQEIPQQKTTAAPGHSSQNLNPFSSVPSSPLDEPETEESEPEQEESIPAGSNVAPPPERRTQNRLPMTASTYVQLSDGNGGLMTNLSKTGFCVRAAKTLESDQLPVVRFQLPDAREFVESSAWIVWKSPSKKMIGARFETLSDEAHAQITQWIDAQPLPKTASTKNPLSKNRPSSNPRSDSSTEQRERMSPLPKTPVPVTAAPVTLMSPDSVPIPAYISPLAISLDPHPAVPSANNPSSSPSVPPLRTLSPVTAPPIASPIKPLPLSTEKTLAPAPTIVPAPASAKSASVAAAPASPQSQKPRSTQLPMPSVPKLASPAATVPTRTPAAPFGATKPFAPIFNEPDWSAAPKRPTGYWKIAAMIVVIVGTLLGAATLLRSKKSATPVSQETAQNSSVAASVPAVTSTENSAANSASPNQPTTPATASTPNPGRSREFYDAPRNTNSSKTSAKGDEQFVDEPRPARAQAQTTSVPTPSTASDQPSRSAIQSGTERNQNQPTSQNSGFPEVGRRVEVAPTPVSANANGEAASAPDSAAPPPASAASQNRQPDTNLASAASVTRDPSPSAGNTAASGNNSASQTSINPSPANTTAAVPASSNAAAIPNPVPTVSVFSRFRAIRSTTDAAHPAGSDLQVGRLKSGPAPPYPVEALRQQIQGTVELEVLVGADGNILSVHLVKGPPELASAAMGAVRSWQYGQTTLGGHPVETDQSIYFTFKLTK